MKYQLLLVCFLLSFKIFAQDAVICEKASQDIFESKIDEFYKKKYNELEGNDRILAIAKSFLNTTYVAQTLEIKPEDEVLTVNLIGIDCTTFLEYVLAMNLLLEDNQKSFEEFTDKLQIVRYRDGEIDGYPSRLHYFSEWLQNNEKKDLFTVISKDLGGQPMNKELNFMSSHRDSYPQLKSSDENVAKMRAIESEISPQNIYFIPQDEIQSIEENVNSGDLIAITTNLKGLDIVHVGFAYKQNNRLHLLHASTSTMSVVISDKPLADMITKNKIQNGIIVSRVN